MAVDGFIAVCVVLVAFMARFFVELCREQRRAETPVMRIMGFSRAPVAEPGRGHGLFLAKGR